MEKEFNLSNKIDGQRRIDGELVLSIEDVKEFIKRLKELRFRNGNDRTDFLYTLDKLVGSSLLGTKDKQ